MFAILHFSYFLNYCFFMQLPIELEEWKYTPAENGNPQANYKCTGSIQNSLNLGAIQLSSYPAHVSMVLCVASAVEDASSLHSAQHLVSIWRARVGNAHRSWKKKNISGFKLGIYFWSKCSEWFKLIWVKSYWFWRRRWWRFFDHLRIKI